MTAVTPTLAAWLLEQIADAGLVILNWDSAGEAQVAVVWRANKHVTLAFRRDGSDEFPWIADGKEIDDARHVQVLFDPARVLAEYDARRRIVAHHNRVPDGAGDGGGDRCSVCTSSGPDAQGWPCLTLRLLALPYANRPGYRSEWRP